MENPMKIEPHADQPALAIRTHTPVEGLPTLLGDSFMQLEQHLTAQGSVIAGPPFVAYYNMDMQNLDVAIGFPVQSPAIEDGDMRNMLLPAGDYASYLFVGNYQDMEPAYAALNQFINAQGRTPTGVAFEFYLTEPEVQPPQTLIMLPLQ